MSRVPSHQQRPLAALPPPSSTPSTALLPTEVAIVCVVDDSARTSDRWNDIVKEGGYLDRFVQRLSAGPGVAKQLRISLLSYSTTTSPLQTPIHHTQYFLAPTEFWSSVRQPAARRLSGSNSTPPTSPLQGSPRTGGGGEQGLLEGLVGGIELFDLHTSHPFVLPTPSPSPPYIPQHPIPSSSASSTSSNTSPQNFSHLSPPNSNPQSSSSHHPPPQPSPRPNVERYLFVFLGDDPSPSSTAISLPAEVARKMGRWGKKPSSSVSSALGGGGKVRWNRTRKLDGVGWDELSQEMRKRGVRSSLVGMGVGTGETEMKRLKELFKKNSFSSNDPAWFPTHKGDLLLLYGLDPTNKTHLKRPHSQTSPPSSTASPSSLASSLPQKRQRVAAPGALPYPPSVPSQMPNLNSSAVLHAQLQQQQQQQRLPDVQDLQAHRIQAAQRMLANNPAAVAAQLAARGGQGMLPPSLGAVPGIPANIQSQYAAVASVAASNGGPGVGGAGGPPFDLASASANALAQQYHRQKLQAQVSAVTSGSSPLVPPPPSLPNLQQQQHQQQQQPQRPQQQTPKTIWSGDLGWQVSGSAKGLPNLGCRINAAPATRTNVEEFQTHLWGERIQLSGAVSFKMDEIKMYASKGTPCVSLRYSPDLKASAEERASGERSFLLLTSNLSTKQIAGVVKIGAPGCGMLVFPMSQAKKTTQDPSGSAHLMGMLFLRSPIPSDLMRTQNSNPPQPPYNNLQQNSPHMQQQQQQHHPLQPPNLTIKTGHQQQQQQQQLVMERAQATMALQKQQHQQKMLQQQQQQQLQQSQNQQQQHGQPNLNFLNGGINLASAGLYGGSGSVGAGTTGMSDQQMADFLKAYPQASQPGAQQRGWP
ncbi:hypothetical protein BDY24DRAFT_399276 [Mrakia frigida]|uniref:uncharacterized protein n=1 Tax=Mrakia frigida TaxID=29902 RepID=UPI003FCBF8AC